MAFDIQAFGIDRLTVPERLQLVDFILAGLPEEMDPAELSDWQIALIDQRCGAADANPSGGKPWREVLDRIDRAL